MGIWARWWHQAGSGSQSVEKDLRKKHNKRRGGSVKQSFRSRRRTRECLMPQRCTLHGCWHHVGGTTMYSALQRWRLSRGNANNTRMLQRHREKKVECNIGNLQCNVIDYYCMTWWRKLAFPMTFCISKAIGGSRNSTFHCCDNWIVTSPHAGFFSNSSSADPTMRSGLSQDSACVPAS